MLYWNRLIIFKCINILNIAIVINKIIGQLTINHSNYTANLKYYLCLIYHILIVFIMLITHI